MVCHPWQARSNVDGSMHLYSVKPDGTDPVVLNASGSVYYASF